MVNRFVLTLAVGALLVSARPLAAQRLRGEVLLPDSSTPAGGVIVVATGSDGAERRALTNQRGAFDLPLLRAGRFDVRVLRIGFAPTIVPAVEVAATEAREVRIVLGGARIALARVTVRGRDECNTKRDAGVLVARVWEEARKALLASQLVSDKPLVAEWIEYDRTLDPAATRVREQRVRSTRSPTTHAFRSRPADSLAADGYIVEDSGSTTFYAPDADVLLSESFAVQHCFHVEPPPEGNDVLLGLGFTPSRARRDSKDIEGTLWLDRESAELRWLEYRYTNVPLAAERAGTGGRVEFLRLASGEWLVSRWNILMAQLGTVDRTTDGTRKILKASPDAPLKAVQVRGGEVISVARGDSVMYHATGAGVSVQLFSRDARQSAAGAVLSLDGTDYFAKADSAGMIRLSPVLAGKYRASVRSVRMDSLGMPGVAHDVTTHGPGDARVDSIALPSADEVLAAVCPRDSVKRGEGMIHGVVTDAAGQRAARVAVDLKWKDPAHTKLNDPFGAAIAWQHARRAVTDESGRWRFCGVPREVELQVSAVSESASDSLTTQLGREYPFASAALHLRPAAVATAGPGGAMPAAVRRDATVEITVVDPQGQPLSDATVEITSVKPSPAAVTDETGRALFSTPSAGRVTARVRRIGFTAGEVSFATAAGGNAVKVVLGAVAPVLDTVRVMGDKVVLARHEEFEDRLRRHEATASFTEDEIKHRNPTQTWQMLTTVPAMRVSDRQEHGDFVVVASSSRGMVTGSSNNQPCFMRVMVDGVPLPPDDPVTGRTNLGNLPPPSEIHGIEVFAGGASVPVKYGGAGAGKWCGLIAIWTK